MKEITITAKDAGQRLDKYLRKYMPEAGSGFLYKMLRKKNITLNGKKAEGNELLNAADVIRIFFADDTLAKMRGKAMPEDKAAGKECDDHKTLSDKRLNKAQKAYGTWKDIEIVYEDDDLLFVNKPAGMLSQGDESDLLSLNDWICGYCLVKDGGDNEVMQTSVCNRLDRNTSGLVLCGKTYAGSRFLSDQIKAHGFRKIYRALVEGHLSGEAVLKGYWSKDTASNLVKITKTPDNKRTVSVETVYRALDYNAREDVTLVEVELITGKSHQIRAHMASIGHPLAGDVKYGGHVWHGKKMQFLHAYKVHFPEITGDFARLSEKEFVCRVSWLEDWG